MRAITRPAPDLARRPIPDSAVYRSAANSQFLTETSDHYPPCLEDSPEAFLRRPDLSERQLSPSRHLFL